MPVIQIKCNIDLEEKAKNRILKSMVKLVSDVMKKPSADVMIIFSTLDVIFMDDTFESAVFIDLRFISGICMDSAKILCEGFYCLFKEEAEIDSSRIYVNFLQVDEERAWRFIENYAVCPKSRQL